MAESKLITGSDIGEFYLIGKNINQSLIDESIMTAQQNDLEPVLGGALYRDLVENPDTQLNVDLFQGIDYEINSATIYFRGVRAQLSCYAAARLVRKKQAMFTRSGLKQKETVNSLPTEITEENQIIRDLYSRAKKFENDVVQYLDEKEDEYPLWQRSQGKQYPRKGSFRIHKVW